MSPLTNAICVHAQADDLRFLNLVKNRMKKLLGLKLNIQELGNQASHAEAKLALKGASRNLVVLFTHGSGDYLRGGEYRSRARGEVIETEKFITKNDLEIFSGNVVFCMSCDSNGLAQSAIDSGAQAFVGFDRIPFNRFSEDGDPVGSHVLVKHCQELLAEAVKAALEHFLTGHATLDESVDFLRLYLVKRAIEYVRSRMSVKERQEIAALLLQTKDGLRYHGRRGIRFDL